MKLQRDPESQQFRIDTFFTSRDELEDEQKSFLNLIN